MSDVLAHEGMIEALTTASPLVAILLALKLMRLHHMRSLLIVLKRGE